MKIFIPSRNLILTTTVFLVFIVPLRAQNRPEDYLEAHNQARAAVGVGPLRWDNMVASYAYQVASQRANTCAIRSSGGPYGENIALSIGDSMSAAGAVDMWVREKADYDYNSNTCAPGKVCGHYTQVVWSNSEKLGCARVTCNRGTRSAIFFVCSYDPPGNYIDQRPYLNEKRSS